MNSSEAEVRQIIESRATVRKGNVEAMSADVADDVSIFDVVVPLRRLGKASSKTRAAELVASFEGAIDWESRDVEVFADGDVAFSHSLGHVTGKQKTGAEVDMWFRTTLGLQRRERPLAGRPRAQLVAVRSQEWPSVPWLEAAVRTQP